MSKGRRIPAFLISKMVQPPERPGAGTGVWRSPRAQTLFLVCVIRCMAANQLGNDTLLDSEIVPLARLH